MYSLYVPHGLFPNAAVLNVLSSDSKASYLFGIFSMVPSIPGLSAQPVSPPSQQGKDHANSSGLHLKFDLDETLFQNLGQGLILVI